MTDENQTAGSAPVDDTTVTEDTGSGREDVVVLKDGVKAKGRPVRPGRIASLTATQAKKAIAAGQARPVTDDDRGIAGR
ncbi:hypothetical protein [Maricaulis maris]|uniref:hypothetical protein n=1 Tax=Maricaulis maris TaxID=74318 RepID=UPI003B8BEF61